MSDEEVREEEAEGEEEELAIPEVPDFIKLDGTEYELYDLSWLDLNSADKQIKKNAIAFIGEIGKESGWSAAEIMKIQLKITCSTITQEEALEFTFSTDGTVYLIWCSIRHSQIPEIRKIKISDINEMIKVKDAKEVGNVAYALYMDALKNVLPGKTEK